MLQQLTTETGAQLWAIISMILFMVVFAGVLILTAGKGRDELERCAQLPLEDASPMPREDAAAAALTSKQGR